MRNVCAVILAGGKSKRMGANKALLPFGGFSTLAEYQFRRLKACGLFESVALSLKAPLLPFEAPLILDESELFAPIMALAAILKRAANDRVFILAVDTPFFNDFRRLIDIDAPAAIARSYSGIHPLCAVYNRSLLPRFENAIKNGEYSIKKALKEAPIVYADFDEKSLINLNYPDQYQRAKLSD
ncbi:MAG: NTP transferase domain-containing protein [Helicobacteraceae bacterium]|jgi:molybdopterin-guanine dinucleotide biosynthesis protein A|nr:NTP transferase domain-containing protein [Helicobacteraceae bacterium]